MVGVTQFNFFTGRILLNFMSQQETTLTAGLVKDLVELRRFRDRHWMTTEYSVEDLNSEHVALADAYNAVKVEKSFIMY
jgi:hypothetical protein